MKIGKYIKENMYKECCHCQHFYKNTIDIIEDKRLCQEHEAIVGKTSRACGSFSPMKPLEKLSRRILGGRG